MSRRQPCLLAYDITDRRRLARVHRYLGRHGQAMQHSVFLCHWNTRERELRLAELAKLIDPRRDDLRCYPLPASPDIVQIGPTLLPEGALLLARSWTPA